MAAQVVLILGAGANVGAKTAEVFAKSGYKVALVTRTITHHKDNTRDLVIQADFAEPLSIKSVFDEVKAKIGTPNVIVYNGAYSRPVITETNPTALNMWKSVLC